MPGHALTPIIAMQQEAEKNAELMRTLQLELDKQKLEMAHFRMELLLQQELASFMDKHRVIEAGSLSNACSCGAPTPQGYADHIVSVIWD